ncbi:hypothetical protein EYF80_003329 [Liparis tanakae]|uniref:Uncharacterized protein n=1 Tax=Liparis tanakae TaxID=230148 RepID=A0A4Z2J8Q9_9TELE|nr:hypothetical protein EYF80_003329 [Liparis tanakae]
MKSKHCNVAPPACLVKLRMQETLPDRRRCSSGMAGAARRPDMSGPVLPQQEIADWVARTLSILGILRAANSSSFVPPSAHGWAGKGLRAFGLVVLLCFLRITRHLKLAAVQCVKYDTWGRTGAVPTRHHVW